MNQSKPPLTNAQLEILKAFSYELPPDDLIEFRDVIASYFSNKAIAGADRVWEAENWDDTRVEELLNSKLRHKGS